MSTEPLQIERLPDGAAVPKIAEMGAWFFWARTNSLGLPAEDVQAVRDGSATPEQIGRLREIHSAAMHSLLRAPINRESYRGPS